jgi:PAS domain S-box-containing protein
MRWRRWLQPIVLPAIGLIGIGGLVLFFVHQRAQEELRTNGDDLIAIAAFRDSVLLFPAQAVHYQKALAAELRRQRPTPYRGSPTFLDSLGLWDADTFVERSRGERALLENHQIRLARRLEHLAALQNILFFATIGLSLLLIPLLLFHCRVLDARAALAAQLQASEARARELVEAIPEPIQLISADGRLVYANPAWHRLMGYSPEELPQLRFEDLLPPEQRLRWRSTLEQVLSEDTPLHLETVLLTKEEHDVLVSGTLLPYSDPVTGARLVQGIFRDITAERRHLQSLQYQEALANTISQIAQQLLTSLHPETPARAALSQLGEILNTEALYLVALPTPTEPAPQLLWVREQEEEEEVSALFRPPTWEHCRPLWERLSAIAIVEATEDELRQECMQGHLCRVRSLLWVPLVRNGELWGFIGTEDWKSRRIWSPTERTALESVAAAILSAFDRAWAYQQLQRFAEDLLEARNALEAYAEELRQTNEELQKRNEEKDRIMSIISHDLRSPLSGIRGLAELLSVDAENPDIVREFAHLIYEATDHLLSLINDLLEVVRVESGRVRLNPTETDLCELARSAIRIVEGMTRLKKVHIELDCPSDPILATVDAPKLTQVINNLLSNAIKFTPSEGRVTLRLRPLPDNTVELQVCDTGIGIPPELLPHIFEKFGPHQRPGTAGEKGTGLGLPIVKHFVELHGGTISVESTVGVGTCFTVRLPCSCPAPQEQ